MNRVDELTTVAATVPQARRVLTDVSRFHDWVAPDITVTPLSGASTLDPGVRFRVEMVGAISFEYHVEVVSDREVVFAFHGPWSGRERWSFVADGDETVVRRVYEFQDSSVLGELAWRSIGRPLVLAHFKLELSRFRAAVERDPGPRAEIEPRTDDAPPAAPSFPIDDG
jgi:hypothetical protein